METYDVVIIGAGPAGLSCAKALSKSGKSVMLLEKNKVIGPKVCAGGVTRDDLSYLNLPEGIADCKFKEIRFNTRLQKTRVNLGKLTLYTIDRGTLGQWQLSRLGHSKVVVKTGSLVTEISEDYVIAGGKKIGFRHLVGADGSSSIVRRHIGLKTKTVEMGIQYIVPVANRREMEVFMDSRKFGPWYAWVFPHKGYASVGCGCDPRVIPLEKLRKNFTVWLKAMGIDVSNSEYQACPLNCDFRGYRFGNIFLIGDAAGLISPITGEGICTAIISGREVGKVILDSNYKPKELKRIIRLHRLHARMLLFARFIGPFRPVGNELIALLLKSKLFVRLCWRLFISG